MELTKKVLIIASVALALVIALIGISIAALYYSLNPSLYLGNIRNRFDFCFKQYNYHWNCDIKWIIFTKSCWFNCNFEL